MPSVSIPPPYQGPTQGEGEIPVEGATVRACLEAVDAKFPGFAAQIFDDDGQIHRFVKLFVDEEPVAASALDDPIPAGCTVTIVAAIGGGRGDDPAQSLW